MANAGPNTNGSQFFITHVATELSGSQAHRVRPGDEGPGCGGCGEAGRQDGECDHHGSLSRRRSKAGQKRVSDEDPGGGSPSRRRRVRVRSRLDSRGQERQPGQDPGAFQGRGVGSGTPEERAQEARAAAADDRGRNRVPGSRRAIAISATRPRTDRDCPRDPAVSAEDRAGAASR